MYDPWIVQHRNLSMVSVLDASTFQSVVAYIHGVKVVGRDCQLPANAVELDILLVSASTKSLKLGNWK